MGGKSGRREREGRMEGGKDGGMDGKREREGRMGGMEEMEGGKNRGRMNERRNNRKT